MNRDLASTGIPEQTSILDDLDDGMASFVDLIDTTQDALPVPPVTAPDQSKFVTLKPSSNKYRRCARVGCEKNAYECGGFRPDMCRNENVPKLRGNEHEEAKRLRDELARKRKAEWIAQRRAASKPPAQETTQPS